MLLPMRRRARGRLRLMWLPTTRQCRERLMVPSAGKPNRHSVRVLQASIGMSIHPIRAGAFLSLLTWLTGCGSAEPGVQTEIDPGVDRAAFSTTPGEPNHEQITATALSFLRPEIITALQVANVATDAEFFLVNANHFDDCNFSGGSAVVADSQARAVEQLAPSAVTPEADLAAIRYFARSLHALQDFYAHTNWIELGGDELVDQSLTAFPILRPYSTIASSGFVVVQGEKPHEGLTRDKRAPYPSNAIVRAKPGKSRVLGLISGTVDYEKGDFCPPPVAMTHEELNKDKSTNVGRTKQYEAAKALAILQTEHEWCRLRGLTRAKWGTAGVGRLDSWVASGATAPTCD